jgi:tRNA/rRNA methyltransferase
LANFGLTGLRLVRPRDGWPSGKALAAASGAMGIIGNVEVFEDERAAVADCPRVYAPTARPRELIKAVMTPERAVREMRLLARAGTRSAIVFGGERAGLTNDQISLADAIITVPSNPRFASLNLAQAVLLLGYEWFKLEAEAPECELPLARTELASRESVYHLFDHLELELEQAGFFFPPETRAHMVRNIRSVLLRAGLTDREVRTWRGMIKALSEGPRRRK